MDNNEESASRAAIAAAAAAAGAPVAITSAAVKGDTPESSGHTSKDYPAAAGSVDSNGRAQRLCGHCNKPKHDRRTCPELRAAVQARTSDDATGVPGVAGLAGPMPTAADLAAALKRGVRTCGYCKMPKHDRRNCPRLMGTPEALALKAKRGPRLCRHCEKPGHDRRNCPDLEGERMDGVGRTRSCSHCNKPKHDKRTCPLLAPQREAHRKALEEARLATGMDPKKSLKRLLKKDDDKSGPARPRRCGACNAKDHDRRNCPALSAEGKLKPRRCSVCQSNEHTKPRCPMRPKKKYACRLYRCLPRACRYKCSRVCALPRAPPAWPTVLLRPLFPPGLAWPPARQRRSQ